MKRWSLAEYWEVVADAVPDAPAIVEGDRCDDWRTYEQRAARFAAALADAGVGLDAKVGLYGYNSKAYLEAQFGILKVRGVSVNVNYHYTEIELEYLLENADAEAIVFDARFGPRLAAIRDRLPKLRTFIEIDDGSGEHLAGALCFDDLMRRFEPMPRQSYSPDDHFIFYTGGTTGSPKGVLFQQGEFILISLSPLAALGYDIPQSAAELTAIVQALRRAGTAPKTLPTCPLMHAAALWGGVFMTHNQGGCVVIFRNEKFDPDRIWTLAEHHRVTDIMIVGDAFARPMLIALEKARARDGDYNLSSLKVIMSSGAMFSREVKQGLLSFADIVIRDAMGATEGSMAGIETSRASPPGETARFMPNSTTKVFLEDGREVIPGSNEIGLVANGGPLPLGYYKDPEKTAATFQMINGKRYGVPGDYATIAADGALMLVGRGSGCINSGGEKIFPEEVEKVLASHPSVMDCVVVGAPDERFGQRVVAIVSAADGRAIQQDDLIGYARQNLAGYKTPKVVIMVDHFQRKANGKQDYDWAKLVLQQASQAITA